MPENLTGGASHPVDTESISDMAARRIAARTAEQAHPAYVLDDTAAPWPEQLTPHDLRADDDLARRILERKQL